MKLWRFHNISDAEYTCHCCGEYPAVFDSDKVPAMYCDLFNAFSDIRREWGEPIVINSGFRCARHNAEESKSLLSAHVFGLALDMRTGSEEKSYEMYDLIRSLYPNFRVGVYPRFVHMDVAYMINPKVLGEWRKGVEWNNV